MIRTLDAYGLFFHRNFIIAEQLENEVTGINGRAGFGPKARRIKNELNIADQKLALIQSCIISSLNSN